MAYRIAPNCADGGAVIRMADGAFIPPDERNADWQAYRAWREAGNDPDPAEEYKPVRNFSKKSIRYALIDAGKWSAFFGALSAASTKTQAYWESEVEFPETSPKLARLAQAAGIELAEILALAAAQ